jgi:3-oxocholest-4-en-26-oate---CoA ligase
MTADPQQPHRGDDEEQPLRTHELGLGDVQELVSGQVRDRAALVWRRRQTTHGELTSRTRRLANALNAYGLGSVVERAQLQPWEAGQDFVGVLMHNRPEFIEALFGSFKARCVPFNINYRYTAAEIRHLIDSCPFRALVYENAFAPVVNGLRPVLPLGTVLIEVGGEADRPAVPGATPYETVLTSSTDDPPAQASSPDDLFVVFTGGTTGAPKAVLWRQADMFVAGLTGPEPVAGVPIEDVLTARIAKRPRVTLPAAPFMHGAGQWVALGNVLQGNTVAIQEVVDRLDPRDIWETVAREGVGLLFVTGNAFAVPLLDELHRSHYELPALRIVLTGAVAMTEDVKHDLMAAMPRIRIVETVGASESGTQMSMSTNARSDGGRAFAPSPGTIVLDEQRSRRLAPGESAVGWLARLDRVPLGYLGDPEKTATTFPVVAGRRCAVPGDRARLLASGDVELLGRDAVTINSGGEKVFAEEVEAAIVAHPAVQDALVAGRPHPRWDQEIVALVQLRSGSTATGDELVAHASATLAKYKQPREVIFVPEIRRSAVGKADYAWAAERAAERAD